MRSGAKGLAAFALAAAFCLGSALAEAPRRVLNVYDGDTLTVRGLGTVRLLGFDAPEIGWRARCPREDALAREARWQRLAQKLGVPLLPLSTQLELVEQLQEQLSGLQARKSL